MSANQITRLVAALGISSIVACSESAGPAETEVLEGTYVLRTVNDENPPVVVAEHEGGRFIALADTLRFTRAGKATRTQVMRRLREAPALPRDTIYRFASDLLYRSNGDSLTIAPRCPPDVDCIGPATGTFGPDGLRMTGFLFYGSKVVRFEKIDAR